MYKYVLLKSNSSNWFSDFLYFFRLWALNSMAHLYQASALPLSHSFGTQFVSILTTLFGSERGQRGSLFTALPNYVNKEQ